MTSPTAPVPPLWWQAIAFLGGLLLMLNQFHHQGVRYLGSEALFRFLSISVSPIVFGVAGLLAMMLAGRAGAGPAARVGRLLVSSFVWSVIVLVPLVLLEAELFPIGRGVPQGVAIAFGHLPFVGVFLAGLWSLRTLHGGGRRAMLATWLPAPAGFLFGIAMVLAAVLGNDLGYHWQRCRDTEGIVTFVQCIL
jgi:hypothetical protein